MPRMPKNMQRRRARAPRRRNANGSTVARDQTKYHRQRIGFEYDVVVPSGGGAIAYISPVQYPALPPASFSVFSQNFYLRFYTTWKAYRMLGWRCEVVCMSKPNDQSEQTSVIAISPFNQSIAAGDDGTIVPPPSLQVLCELPNVKMLSTDSANSKNRATFSYFQGRRDINSLPFQRILTKGVPTLYTTGLQLFNDAGYTEQDVIVRIFGWMLVEFKDPAYYFPPAAAETGMVTEEERVHRARTSLSRTRIA